MQHITINPPHDRFEKTGSVAPRLNDSNTSGNCHSQQNLSISVLEWLNAELRKEVEKQEIVSLQSNEKMFDRLQHMLTSKATGITIMVVGLFLM